MAKKGRPNTGTITHRGEHQFHARFSHDGQRVARTFETYEQAQQWLVGLTDGRGKDRFAKTIEARDLTLAEAMTNRLEMKKDLKSHVEQTRQTERLIRNFPDLTGKRLYEIDEIDILDFIEKREEAVGGATINRELSLICNTFDLARTKMRCTRLLNPIGPTTWLKESKGRDHRLAEDEEALLFRVAERADPEHQTPIADIIRFAIATAMRMSEIGAMDWRNVDLTEAEVGFLQVESIVGAPVPAATARAAAASAASVPLAAGPAATGPVTNLQGFVGASAGFNAVAHLVRRVAPTDSTMLFNGESGVGKECFARALHATVRLRGRAPPQSRTVK